VLGASPQDATSHGKFALKYQLNFPLLVDSDLKLAEAYGAVAEKPGEFEGIKLKIKRSTFIIGPDGNIERAMYGVSVKGHVEDVLSSIS
jgi:thioredoxin-dependent peroxiredoxin